MLHDGQLEPVLQMIQRRKHRNYESRILTFHIQKVEGYKSQSYQFVAG